MSNIYLCKPDRTKVCVINGIDPTSVSFTKNLTDLWELTFNVNRYENIDGELVQVDFYESITGGMWIFLETPKDKGYFIIDSDPTIEIDGTTEIKTVTCHSCECEMQKKYLKQFKINTGELDLSLEYLVKDEDGNPINRNPYTQLPYRYITLVDYGGEEWTDTITGDGTTRRFNLSFPINTNEDVTVPEYESDEYTIDPLVPSITFDVAPNKDEKITVTYYRTIYGDVCKQLSLLDLIIEKAELTGWTIDPNISQKLQTEYYTFDVEEQDIYSFFTQQLAATARVLVTFDRVNMVIGLTDEEEIGEDTGVFFSYRNLLNTLNESPANESGVITKYYPKGADNLGIEYVNFGQDYIIDLDYYAHAKDEYGRYKYMSEEMSQRWDDYKEYIDNTPQPYYVYDENTETMINSGDQKTYRELFAQYSRDYNKAYMDKTELYDRLPIDGLVIDYTTYKCYELITAYKAYINAFNALIEFYNQDYPDNPITLPLDPDVDLATLPIKNTMYWLDFAGYVNTLQKIFEAFKIWCCSYIDERTQPFTASAGQGSVTLSDTPESIISVYVNDKKLSSGKYTVSGNVITFSQNLNAGDEVKVNYVKTAYLMNENNVEITLEIFNDDNPIVTSDKEDEEIGAKYKVIYNNGTVYYTNLVTSLDGLGTSNVVNEKYTEVDIARNIEWYLYEMSLYGYDELYAKKTAWLNAANTLKKDGMILTGNTDKYTGNGVQREWTLWQIPNDLTVKINDVETLAYTLSDSTIMFNTAPANGAKIEFIYTYDETYNTPDKAGYERVPNKEDYATESIFIKEMNLFLDYMSDTPRQNGLTEKVTKGVVRLAKEAIEERHQEIEQQDKKMVAIDEKRTEVQELCTYTQFFTPEEREIFNPLITEADYTNENFLITNLDNIVTTVDQEQKLFKYSVKELSKQARPQWHFDIGLSNLFQLSEYKPEAKVVDVGNWIRVQSNLYKDKFVRLRILSYQYNPVDISDTLTLTFSNVTYSYNKMSDLDYIFSNMGGTTSGSTGTSTGSGSSGGTYGENNANITLSNTMLNAFLSSDNYNNMLNNKISEMTGKLIIDEIQARIIQAEEITVGGKIRIDENGVTVGYGQDGYSYVSDDGLDVYKNNNKVASFGNSAELISGTKKAIVDANGLGVYDITIPNQPVKKASFGDTAEIISGTKKLSITTNGINITNGGTQIANFGSTIELNNSSNSLTMNNSGVNISNGNNKVAISSSSVDLINGTKKAILNSNGMTVSKINNNTETIIASFGDNVLLKGGTVTLDNGTSKAVVNSNGMTISNINNNTETVIASFGTETVIKTTDGTELAHFGYASGTAESGTEVKPYYTFGTRKINRTIGNYSIAEGIDVEASGYSSHAEGADSIARGKTSHAEGSLTTASGSFSHAEGSETTASGNYSHAEGSETTASGDYSHAEGDSTTAIGDYSHAGGRNTIAGYDYQTIIGKNNKNKSDTLFEIGNGSGTYTRSNAFEVYQNGLMYTPFFETVGADLLDGDTTGIMYTLEQARLYMLYFAEYNSDGSIRGRGAYEIQTPNNTTGTPVATNVGLAGNRGISVTYSANQQVLIKCSENNYTVRYTLYRVC